MAIPALTPDGTEAARAVPTDAARLHATLGERLEQIVVAEHVADTNHHEMTVGLLVAYVNRFRHAWMTVVKHPLSAAKPSADVPNSSCTTRDSLGPSPAR